MTESDAAWMDAALYEAEKAGASGEVPVGCVIVAAGRVVGTGRNARELARDPTAHAEMIAIKEAARAFPSWRLSDATAYVTLEPCAMCAGALVNARVARVVYGCTDPKAGAIHTMFGVGLDPRLNHRFDVTAGVREAECRGVLQRFFGELRKAATGG
ncbi:MAG: tRNA adenosine(34) deaminase TadA [Polyangiaceae bacterium]|jgi:tRNA(adenine34) deaminase